MDPNLPIKTYSTRILLHIFQVLIIVINFSLAIALCNPPGEVPRPPPHGAAPMCSPLSSSPSLPPEPSYGPPFLKLDHLKPSPLYKQHSWSPDIHRDKAWLRRKGNCRNRRSKSVTDEDLDELKACIELGFGFDSPESLDQRLSDTSPALSLYYAVNKQYYHSVGKSATATTSSPSTPTECDSPSSLGSPHTIFEPGENPQTVKTRLRQWAQVVACSVRQCSS